MSSSLLQKLDSSFNSPELRRSTPSVEIHRNVIYMPINDDLNLWDDKKWGIYDVDGRIVDAAAYYRGPGKALVGQSSEIRDNMPTTVEKALPGRYIYGGNLFSHYGHFLISTLSRLWIGLERPLADVRLVFHGNGFPDGWWSHRFVREVFSALGIRKENLVIFKRPTLIDWLEVPRPSAEENNFSHETFGEWGRLVGTTLLSERALNRSARPAWLSKARLGAAVQGLINEEELTFHLAHAGVDVFYPEELSLRDQLALLHERPIVMGTASSAFHTSIMTTNNTRLACLNMEGAVNGNFTLIDNVSTSLATYYSAPNNISRSAEPSKFDVGYLVADPKGLADALMEIIGV